MKALLFIVNSKHPDDKILDLKQLYTQLNQPEINGFNEIASMDRSNKRIQIAS